VDTTDNSKMNEISVYAAVLGRKGGLVSKRTPELFICTHPMIAIWPTPVLQLLSQRIAGVGQERTFPVLNKDINKYADLLVTKFFVAIY
jgi:hypothetical protein